MLIASFAACSAPTLSAEIAADPADQALVVMVEQAGKQRFWVRDPAVIEPIPALSASDGEPLTVTVLGYAVGLDVVGFAVVAGELVPAQASDRPLPLTGWARARTRTIALDDDGLWRDADAARLEGIQVAAAPPCRTNYSSTNLALTSTAPIAEAYSDDEGHAMIAQKFRDEAPVWLRFDDRGAFERVPPPVPDLSPSASALGPDGVLFLAGVRDGRHEVWTRRAPGEPFTALPATPAMRNGSDDERVRFMSAAAGGVLWAMTARGRVSRFDGGWIDAQSADVIHPFLDAQIDRWITEIRGVRRTLHHIDAASSRRRSCSARRTSTRSTARPTATSTGSPTRASCRWPPRRCWARA